MHGRSHVRPAAVGGTARGEGVALDVGRRAVGPCRPEASHCDRLGGLRGRLHRLCNRVERRSVRCLVSALWIYFALAEGAEKALVADLTPAGRQGLAFGYYNAALGVGALTASVVFGFLYERVSPSTAFTVGAVLAMVATILLAITPTAPNPAPRT
jgi:hypothetical protein